MEVMLFSKTTTAKFEEFRQNLKFCDVSLQSGHVVVKAHRVVLAAASPYFEAMFSAGLKESNEEVVNLPSISPDVLPILVDFMYTGHVTMKSSTAQQLMAAAHMLCLDSLVSRCALYLKTQLDPYNAFSMLSYAETFGCLDLAEFTLSYIGEHWTTIVIEKELLDLPLALFTRILSSEKFAVDNEYKVLLAVVRWLGHDCARMAHCADLMRLLRLGRLPLNVFDFVCRNLKDTWLAESFRLCSERVAATADTRARGRGALYVVGNPNGGLMGSVMKYHVYEKFWEVIVPMETYRHHPNVAALGGRLYVVGGYNNSALASGEVYDPATNEWSPIADMNEARSDFGLAALKGRLYAFGGHGLNGVLSSVESYDPAVDHWTLVGDLPYAIREGIAVTYDDAVYLTHGRFLLRYEPGAEPLDTWSVCADMDSERYEHAAAVLNNHLYVLGGCDLGDRVGFTVERYNFMMDRWEYMTSRPTQERCVVGAADGVLLVAGESILHTYVPGAGRWERGPDLPLHSCVVGAAVL